MTVSLSFLIIPFVQTHIFLKSLHSFLFMAAFHLNLHLSAERYILLTFWTAHFPVKCPLSLHERGRDGPSEVVNLRPTLLPAYVPVFCLWLFWNLHLASSALHCSILCVKVKVSVWF